MEDALEWGIWPVTLEVRESGRSIFGSFPYNSSATRGDRGSVRKERFRPGGLRLRDPQRGSRDQPIRSTTHSVSL